MEGSQEKCNRRKLETVVDKDINCRRYLCKVSAKSLYYKDLTEVTKTDINCCGKLPKSTSNCG